MGRTDAGGAEIVGSGGQRVRKGDHVQRPERDGRSRDGAGSGPGRSRRSHARPLQNGQLRGGDARGQQPVRVPPGGGRTGPAGSPGRLLTRQPGRAHVLTCSAQENRNV